jgi:tripartite-type tricarboxylate transporter receptor subunit TctC
MPQDVPAERVKIIRDAFNKTMEDPKFLAEAKKLRRPVDPLSGEELQQVFNQDVNPKPEMFELVSEIFRPGKKK